MSWWLLSVLGVGVAVLVVVVVVAAARLLADRSARRFAAELRLAGEHVRRLRAAGLERDRRPVELVADRRRAAEGRRVVVPLVPFNRRAVVHPAAVARLRAARSGDPKWGMLGGPFDDAAFGPYRSTGRTPTRPVV